jgi:putative transposase
MATYIRILGEAAAKHGLDIHGWVLMTNHIHLLVTPEDDEALSRTMQTLGQRYVHYFNRVYQRTGTLFEGRFKSCIVQQSQYFLICLRYIELNPVRAGMVQDPADYIWSSYRINSLGLKSSLWQPHPQYLALGATSRERQVRYRTLFESHVEDSLLLDIRQSINQGLAFGSDEFKRQVEVLGGRRQVHLKRGPKAK